jgi:hypothetical protein
VRRRYLVLAAEPIEIFDDEVRTARYAALLDQSQKRGQSAAVKRAVFTFERAGA